MNKKDSKIRYNELCLEYGKTPSTGEFEAFDRYVAKVDNDKYEKILEIVRGFLNEYNSKPFPSHFDKAIKQYFGPPKIEKKDDFTPRDNQLEINRRGSLLVNFVMFQTETHGKAARSNVKGVKTLLGFKIKEARDAIDRLYEKGDWAYFANRLDSEYLFKNEIDKLALKESG